MQEWPTVAVTTSLEDGWEIPLPDGPEIEVLLLWAADEPNGRWLVTRVLSEATDPSVFSAVFAVQLVAGEPWFVRGVLQQSQTGPPVLSRVAVQHLNDPQREVTGPILRGLRLAAIRDEALRVLPRSAVVQTWLSKVPDALPTHASRRRTPAAPLISKQKAAATREAAAMAAGQPRRLLDDAHYRRIATRFLEIPGRGVLRTLCAEESERWGEDIPIERMKQWLREATDREYLVGVKKGARRLPGQRLTNQKEEDDG